MRFATNAPGNGHQLVENEVRHFINRTGAALSVGGVYALDLTGSDGDVEAFADWTISTHADSAHPFNNVIAVATAHLAGWILCVALAPTANDEWGPMLLSGMTDVRVADSNTAGAKLTGVNAANNLAAASDGNCTFALLLETNSSGGTALRKCLFSGWQLAESEI